MDELQSIANYSGYCTSSFAWEFQNLGVPNGDMSRSMVCTPPYVSSLNSDVSTGYLQDALFEFSTSKRRRLQLSSDDQANYDQSFTMESCWKENCTEDYPDNFDLLSQINEIHCNISGKSMNNSSSSASGKNNNIDERETILTDEMKEAEEAISAFQGSLDSSSSSQTIYSHNKNNNVHSTSLHKETLYSLHGISTSPGDDIEKKRKVITRVVYPFAVVKPGGVEGDMTLNDINERLLMPPTRPVRHPVGEFACRPVASANGPGLSGKAVVALTRIQTRGSGTITIIRTRG
ncbi:Vacuolar iron transporter 1 [Heracleum sosnowskyi]|uniref:Vacuolar iron transporter 1 n=1 Tax=Heracleum sosnowskyi TaxID=360622 RepID=A0AAD8I7Y7_9APIA|nr:Vacuolar iron transporter 1 [Heracleum sosnowskyi]